MKTEDYTMMKFFAAAFGAISSIVFGIFGYMMFFTGYADNIRLDHWYFTVSMIGIVYIAIQLFQMSNNKPGDKWGPIIDIIFSIFIPGAIIAIGLYGGESDTRATCMYVGFFLLDIIILIPTVKILIMTSDVTGI